MTPRFYQCGCGSSLAGKRSDAVWATDACPKRAKRAASAAVARKRKPSGVQVSYFKGIDHIAALLQDRHGIPFGDAMTTARDGLRAALPDRQRARLEGRAS